MSRPVVMERLVDGGAPTLDAYSRRGGYSGLEQALRRPPEELVDTIERSELRGRGGAGFSTGRKWRAVLAQTTVPEKVIVANGDEGDPGAYIDRVILEDDPHSVIEAILIAGRAVGAQRGFVYVRGEYPTAFGRMAQAIEDARRVDILGPRVLGTPFAFDLEVVHGKGSYVCGEETALLNAIEGKRPEVRARPPYPAARGLFGKPTLVQNVETLASVPWIVRHGAEAYRAMGNRQSRGTKVLSLNSLFERPGLYEVEFGLSLRAIVDELGGGLRSGALKGLLVGGPLAGVIPPGLLDTPLEFEALSALGASVGHGGVVAFDDQTTITELAHHVLEFGAFESCGKCTPCRLGTRRLERVLAQSLAHSRHTIDRHEWRDLVTLLQRASLCGHGVGLGDFAASLSRHFGEEFEPCFV